MQQVHQRIPVDHVCRGGEDGVDDLRLAVHRDLRSSGTRQTTASSPPTFGYAGSMAAANPPNDPFHLGHCVSPARQLIVAFR